MMLTALLAATLAIVAVTMLLTLVIGRAAGWIAAAALASLAVIVGVMAASVTEPGSVIRETVPWIPSLEIALRLRLDGLAALFLIIVLGVGAVVIAYSARYLSDRSVHPHTGYFAWMLLFAFAMTGLVLADDLVLLFVFWELTTLCSFFLINRSGRRASAPAVRTLLVTALGGLALLLAVVLIVVRTGTTVVSEALVDPVWSTDGAFVSVIAVLVALAAMTKSAQFPFHMWLPDAMVAPTPVSAYLHAAAMVKAGIYLLLLFSPALAESITWQAILVSSGLITAVMGAVLALRCFDLKEIMAYSTVSQLGLIVALIGVGTPSALTTAALYTLAHALFKATLFMGVGILDQQAGTRDIRLLRGLRRRMPVLFSTMLVAGLSMAGVYPLLGFIAKEYLLGQMLEPAGPAWLGGLLATTAVIAATATFAYTARIMLGGFTRYRGTDEPEDDEELDTHRMPNVVREAPWSFLAPAVLTSVLGIVLAFGITWLHPLLGSAGSAAAGQAYAATFALFGGLTAELALSVTIIVLGLVVVSQRRRLDRLFAHRLLRFTAIDVVERIRTGAITLGKRVGDVTRTDTQTLHLGAPWVLIGGLAIGAVAILPAAEMLVPLAEPWTDAVLLALVVVTAVPAALARSRLTAMILVGGAGFVVALWFFALGAIDVGLTQLLVELLTVVALVLVLRRLPALFHVVSKTRERATAAIAVGVGVTLTLATLAFTGRPDISDVGRYFLEEAYDDTGGTNIVNTILVDYRALDTLGELTVIAVAGFVIIGVLRERRLREERTPDIERWRSTPLVLSRDNTLPVRVVARWSAPVVIVLSLYLLLRGHYEPGGGFIAALVGGTGFALAYLGAPADRAALSRFPYRGLLSAGVVVAVLSGIGGYLAGSFLRPVRVDIPMPWGGDYGFTSALVFDVGVYFAVVAIVIALLHELGGVRESDARPRQLARDAREEVAP
ncbi:MAG: proton-conducting transporter membrane subunit [Microcella sp.]|uniref:hydrogen gas-evolving membrane-bound hydrogenase subunit E n=1 Tax=Microcella sp. TaxID=1913979 RepID=UPI0033158B09